MLYDVIILGAQSEGPMSQQGILKWESAYTPFFLNKSRYALKIYVGPTSPTCDQSLHTGF